MLDIWEQNKYRVHQIDKSVTKRQSKWVLVCSKCQCERVGTYCQAWNIVKQNSSGKCFFCLDRKFVRRSQTSWNKGLKWSKKYNENHRRAMQYNSLFGGIFVTEEGRKKQREAKLGKKDHLANRYIDGRTPENKKLRGSDAYIQLRKQVLKRDNFTCQICLVRGKTLEMDHIKEWCNYPELRFESSNCRALCHECHTKTDNYKTKAIKKRVA